MDGVNDQRAQAASQMQRSLRVWRKASGGDAGAVAKGDEKEGAEVSQPGEPAEKEADAVADKVADGLHGGKGDEKKDGGGKGKKDPAGGKEGAEGEEKAGDAGHEKAPEIGAKLQGVGLKVFRAKKTGKEKADDIPSWAAGCQMNPGETPVQAADRVMRQRFPDGNYPKGPGSEYNKIKKYFERK